MRLYARHLIAVLDRSTRIFDKASVAASRKGGNMNALDQACVYWGDKVQYDGSQSEGIPHPAKRYTLVGRFHHRMAGVYHYMIGAMTQCQTAAEGGDPNEGADAISTIAQATRMMHRLNADAHRQSR